MTIDLSLITRLMYIFVFLLMAIKIKLLEWK